MPTGLLVVVRINITCQLRQKLLAVNKFRVNSGREMSGNKDRNVSQKKKKKQNSGFSPENSFAEAVNHLDLDPRHLIHLVSRRRLKQKPHLLKALHTHTDVFSCSGCSGGSWVELCWELHEVTKFGVAEKNACAPTPNWHRAALSRLDVLSTPFLR